MALPNKTHTFIITTLSFELIFILSFSFLLWWVSWLSPTLLPPLSSSPSSPATSIVAEKGGERTSNGSSLITNSAATTGRSPTSRSLRSPMNLHDMKSTSITKFFSLSFFIFFLFLFLLRFHHFFFTHSSPPIHQHLVLGSQYRDLRIRPGYTSYEAYIQRQLNKTLNPKLRRIWTTRDWDRKIPVFARFFQRLQRENLLRNSSKALCIGARVGQEVEALRRIGVSDSVGIDLVAYPPLVVEGDFHRQQFANETFDFEFSNVFDHALYPEKFVGEIERTLKKGGVCVLHVALSRRADRYSANDLYSVEPLKALFKRSKLLHVRNVDAFGLDTEVAFLKTL